MAIQLGPFLENLPPTTGSRFFVDSGSSRASNTHGGKDPKVPFATIDQAINHCTANNGDQIIVMPGHTESLTTAGQIAMDVAGVSVFGLGQGFTRPRLTYDAAAGRVDFTASDCRWSNIVHVCSYAAVTAAIYVSGPGSATATNRTEIDHCHFTFDASGVEFTAMICLGDGGTSSADYVHIHDNWFEAENIDGCSSALLIDDCQFVHIIDNLFTGDFNSCCIDGAAGSSACTDYVILRNTIWNLDDAAGAAIDLDNSATGIVAHNTIFHADDLADGVDFGACGCIENYVVDEADKYGIVVPTTAAD